jgi:hypothetical protein
LYVFPKKLTPWWDSNPQLGAMTSAPHRRAIAPRGELKPGPLSQSVHPLQWTHSTLLNNSELNRGSSSLGTNSALMGKIGLRWFM